MHGHGIAGALRTAVRRLAAPGTIRTTIAAIAAVAAFAGAVPKASATPVEYDYTGTDFTSVTGVYTPADNVTGDVIFNGPLTPKAANSFTFPNDTPLPFAFALSDGVNTISSSDTGLSFPSGATFVTNAADQIVSANFGVTEQTGSVPNAQSKGIAIFPAGSRGESGTSNGSGIGQSFTAGAWSGPIVSPPPPPPPPPAPSLYLTVNRILDPNTLSISHDPTGITAALTLSNTDLSKSQPNTIKLPGLILPSGTSTLQGAATALGYVGFDWQQTLSGPGPLGYRCQDPSCNPAFATLITASTPDPAQPYGFDYCNPGSPNFIDKSVPGNTCVHPDVYDPQMAKSLAVSDSLCVHLDGAGSCLANLTSNGDTVLNYYDGPQDPCLIDQTGATSGQRSRVYQANLPIKSGGPTIQSRCQSMTVSGHLSFETDLVGILPSGSSVYLSPINFMWTDTFNGLAANTGTGGIGIPVFDTDLSADPQSGTGGITITEIAGEPVSSVSEPPTLVLVLLGMAVLNFYRTRQNNTA